MDWGYGPDQDNIYIANEGGSRNLVASVRKGSRDSRLYCDNSIVRGRHDHWAVISAANGDLSVY